MIASQFLLDERLAELLAAGPSGDRASRPSRKSAAAFARFERALRAILGGRTANRTSRLAAG